MTGCLAQVCLGNGGVIPVSTSTPLGWAERLELDLKLLFQKGALTTVKIALIGRPGRIIEKGEVVFTSMPRFDTPSGD